MRGDADGGAEAGTNALLETCAEVVQASHPLIVFREANGEVVLLEQSVQCGLVLGLAGWLAQQLQHDDSPVWSA